LLRNSRADHVRRLLMPLRTSTPSTGMSGGQSPRRVRGPFAQVRRGISEFEDVSPKTFELIALLGRGSFAKVFKVRHKQRGQMFAMKVLDKRTMYSSNLMRYAMTERNVLAYCRHPYIVALHYAFQTPGHLVLVLQYCPGGSLQQMITGEKRLQESLARLFTAELLLALCHLHARQTIFRDLKPDNVVIDDEGHAMLTDFGLSKEGVSGIRGAKSFCGSLAFLAPEILLRRGHGHAVDIYNLGVVLFAMLTGMPPYFSRDPEALFLNIKSARLEVPSYVSKPARTLIEATMEREPSRRLGAAKTADVQRHPFFAGLDFDALSRRELPSPAFGACSQATPRPRQSASPPASPFEGGEKGACVRSRRRDGRFAPPVKAVVGWEFAAVPTPPVASRGC